MLSTPEKPATNLDVLQSLYTSLFRTELGRLSLGDSVVYVRAIGVDSSSTWLLESQLLAALRSIGISKTISRAKSPATDSLVEISYQPIRKKIVYSKVGSKKIERTANVDVYLRVQGDNGELLVSKRLKEARVDTLPRNDIAWIENANLEFTHGQLAKSFLGRTVQPVVVSLITGFIIYLFYSYRSK